jgi:cytochrome b561
MGSVLRKRNKRYRRAKWAATVRLRNTKAGWGTVSQLFHWGMALLITTVMVLGWTAREWWDDHVAHALFIWHKSIGVLVLGLVIARICWRVWDRRPELPLMLPLTRLLLRLTHMSLYALMFALPLSGWMINSAADLEFLVLGWFPLPAIVPVDKLLEEIAKNLHLVLFWVFFMLLVIHVGAALHHHYRLKDDVLRHMMRVSVIKDRSAMESSESRSR